MHTDTKQGCCHRASGSRLRPRADAKRHQRGPQHEPGAVGGGDEEGPNAQPDQSRLHAEAHAMTMTIAPVVERPADQDGAAGDAQDARIDQQSRPQEGGGHKRDRQGMAERDRHHRQPHDAPIVPVHAERDGEEPAHAGIEPVKAPESRQREPRPYLGHAIWSAVIPGRREAASPGSITTAADYGFRAPSLRSGPGMTAYGMSGLPTSQRYG